MIGTISYACHSGLAHLARSFIQAGVIHRILVIPHPHYHNYNWYPDGVGFSRKRCPAFLDGLKTLVLFETAVGNTWDVVREAKRRGVRIVLVPMYEWSPFPPPVAPDFVACPSLLDVRYYEGYPHAFAPVPVEQEWRPRTRARHFIHNAGHGQRQWTKGTREVLAAWDLVQSGARLTVRFQPGERRTEELWREVETGQRSRGNVEFRYGDFPDEELYATGDVFINAEQYNGLSLPLQEARAAGMLVMTTDRFPTNEWLPRAPLIPVARHVKDRIAVEFERAVVTPEAIAAKVDEWYDTDISAYSHEGREWAQRHSWEALKPEWLKVLGGM